jgi:SHS2 domain-containing protein
LDIGSNIKVQDHSGDLKIIAKGRDYLEALANASVGLVGEIVNLETIQEVEMLQMEAQGTDETDRTIAFLNEIIYLIYTKHWLPKQVKQLQRCNRINCNTLQCTLSGEPLDPERHTLKIDVKAITYHDFEIVHDGDIYSIQFICDL